MALISGRVLCGAVDAVIRQRREGVGVLNDWLGCDCGTMIHDAELRGGLRSTVRTFRHIGIFNFIRQVDEEQVGYGYGKRQVDGYTCTSRALRCATISKSRPGMAKKPNSRKIESPSKLPY